MIEQTAINGSAPTSVMEDPSAQAIARIYADAFLDAAGGNADEPLGELSSFVEDVLEKIPGLRRILFSVIIAREEKMRLIDTVVASRASKVVANFLRVLAWHERLDLLPLIANEARIRQENRKGERRVQVISAQPLSPQTQGKIRDRLAASFAFSPLLETRVDPSLIGGLVIRVGDTVYDSSLATRIKQLRERLLQRSLHEIQSGRDRFSSAEGN